MGFPRMRVFAGPNGSGKTTILNNLKSEIPFGVYVNADDIQLLLQESKVLLFSSFQINVLNEKLQSFFKKSSFAPVKRNDSNLWEKLEVCKNILKVNTTIDSYLAADLADFIRKELVEARISFTFETVMSHQSKIDFMKTSKAAG